ncbi:hypothetical protein M8C13_02140 [Crossiella sp. SN42]|uniref:hypothetical protein n=1 Tax=Crossiella sp. SN42 TaxID=2944808 RepID=UPI00207C49A0|nr:hypothetical protein [Crossiella sp. SN42]MCO1574556.1 hypothetical protein [Crossiella sp. SN42]
MVRWRLRAGGLLSGALLIAGLGLLGLVVLAIPWWIPEVFRSVHDVGSLLIALFAALFFLCLPAVVAVVAGSRPGNAVLHRRVLAMDGQGVWIYKSAMWRSTPHLVPWREAGPVRLSTLDPADDDGSGLGPVLVPWDFLTFGEPPKDTIGLVGLTATAEEIVRQARLRQPELTVLDQRTPPAPGLGGWVLRRRRRSR